MMCLVSLLGGIGRWLRGTFRQSCA